MERESKSSPPLEKEKRKTKDAGDEYGKLTSLHSRFTTVIMHHSNY